jgi:hypothetical protein
VRVTARLRLLAWPLALIVLGGWLYGAKIRDEMVDFGVYRTAAERALHGEALYRPSDGHYQFKYLPVFALVMTPLALVDLEGGKVIWFALSAGLLTAFLRWSVRGLPERRRSERALMWLTVLFMAKFYAHELTLGQTNILLGTLLMAGLLATQVDQPRIAGVLIGLAVFIKPYALLLIPWLAFSYGAAAAASLAVIAAGLLLPTVVYGWSGNVDLLVQWFQTVTTTTESNLLGSDNVSLAAMWAKWLGIGRPAAALATVSTGALLGLVAVTWLRRRTVDNPDYLEYALLMLIVPLLSPQGWDYVLLLGTPAVVCVLDRFPEFSRPWKAVALAALTLMGLTVFDLLGRALYAQVMAFSVVSVAAVGTALSLTQARWSKLA